MENNEISGNKDKNQPHYQRMLDLLELVGLDASDAYKVVGRSIYTYNAPDRMFGKTIATKFKKALGFNPIYLRFGEGEPLLPNSPELVYKYKNNIPNTEKMTLYPNINFTKIEDLPEDVREKVLKEIVPVKFIQIPKLNNLSKEQIDALLRNREMIENDAIKKIKTVFDFLEIMRENEYDTNDSLNADENNSSAETC